MQNEKGEKKRTATEGLIWLLRGMSFTCKALQNVQENKNEELSIAFSKSYEGTLKKFHNFVVKGIFAVRLRILSWRCGKVSLDVIHCSGGHEGVPLPRGFFCEAAR